MSEVPSAVAPIPQAAKVDHNKHQHQNRHQYQQCLAKKNDENVNLNSFDKLELRLPWPLAVALSSRFLSPLSIYNKLGLIKFGGSNIEDNL